MISIKSKIVQSLLAFYFLHEEENLYVNELVRHLGVDKRNLVKKLNELEREGLFKIEIIGNQKYYSLNKKYSLYKEYKRIILKTIGLEKQLKTVLGELTGIKRAFIYGSYAEDRMDAFSDIDIIVIGNHNTVLLQKTITQLQKSTDREINVTSISQQEFDSIVANKDPFITDVLEKKRIEII
ncbi:nucleotidyltransferase domain-containing protein [candidate division WOR-3 bacterium]|nr:nucleotidyltransferase domain-containing protein [candidate division WOR-3 bacterium]